jgi:hypothetical protein
MVRDIEIAEQMQNLLGLLVQGYLSGTGGLIMAPSVLACRFAINLPESRESNTHCNIVITGPLKRE